MGAVEGVAATGLWPTLLGLGAVALLGAVPWIVRLVLRPGTPAVGGAPVEEEAFDADAALARYLARKAEAGEEVPTCTATEPESPASASVRPPFGRKIA